MTEEIVKKHGSHDMEWVNIKFAAKCPTPNCGKISIKKGTLNLLNCPKCEKNFCYVCNKAISGEDHYDEKASCRIHSNPYTDF